MTPDSKKTPTSAKTIRRKAKSAGDEEKAVPPAPAEEVPVTAVEEPVVAAQPAVAPPTPAPAEPTPVVTASAVPPTKPRLSEEYLVQSHYDKAVKQFVAQVAEFPDLRVSALNREAALREIEDKLEAHVENVRRRGDQLPEAIAARKYPEKVELKLSQGLFRRLDNLSRAEKAPIEQLLIELISSGVERRLDPAPRPQPAERRQPPSPPSGNQRHPSSQQQHGQHQGNRRQNMGRTYQHAMESRENFMEYVRNLEKGTSGAGTNWKNRK